MLISEKNQPLLCASFVDNAYYFYQYSKSLNSQIQSPCALLKNDKKNHYQLMSFMCEKCDTELGKYSCSSLSEDRQCYMEISHKV